MIFFVQLYEMQIFDPSLHVFERENIFADDDPQPAFTLGVFKGPCAAQNTGDNEQRHI